MALTTLVGGGSRPAPWLLAVALLWVPPPFPSPQPRAPLPPKEHPGVSHCQAALPARSLPAPQSVPSVWPHLAAPPSATLLSTSRPWHLLEITHPLVCPAVPKSKVPIVDLSCPQTAEHTAGQLSGICGVEPLSTCHLFAQCILHISGGPGAVTGAWGLAGF